MLVSVQRQRMRRSWREGLERTQLAMRDFASDSETFGRNPGRCERRPDQGGTATLMVFRLEPCILADGMPCMHA